MSDLGLQEARYWEVAESGRLHCLLCPHGCRLAEGELGLCRVRQCVGGALRTLNYNRITAANLDPIEKKPLYHFHPGAMILSLGSLGCNLACSFCQNWSISQADPSTRTLTPEHAVMLATSEPDNLGLAYTYNEPFMWYEYVLETAELARAKGLANVLVTNGYVNEAPLRQLLPYIDAMNVDIKSMQDRFYRELCRGKPEPPRRTAELAVEQGCEVEVTNLVIPNWNDSEEEIRALVDWVASVNPELPLHFSRYHPDYRMTEPPTSLETLQRAREIAREKLPYVYLGNVRAGEGEDTICPGCGRVVVARAGFRVSTLSLSQGKCQGCGQQIPI